MSFIKTPADEYSISNLDLDKFTSEEEVLDLFHIWKKETKREYETPEEEAQRFQFFKSNLKYINENNAKRKSRNDCTLGLNNFSDMSFEEFGKIYLHQTEERIMESKLHDGSCLDVPSSSEDQKSCN